MVDESTPASAPLPPPAPRLKKIEEALERITERIDKYHGPESVPAPNPVAVVNPLLSTIANVPGVQMSSAAAGPPIAGKVVAKLPSGEAIKWDRHGFIKISKPAKVWVYRGFGGAGVLGWIVLMLSMVFGGGDLTENSPLQGSAPPPADGSSAGTHRPSVVEGQPSIETQLWTRFGEGQALDLLRRMQASSARYSLPDWQEDIEMLVGPPDEGAED